MFKLLVCGSREIRDKEFVFKTLDFLLSKKNLSEVILIHGAQKSFDKKLDIYYGADYLADLWGKEKNIVVSSFPAPWDGIEGITTLSQMKKNRFGKLYWPGAKNKGTSDMVSKLEKSGISGRKYFL